MSDWTGTLPDDINVLDVSGSVVLPDSWTRTPTPCSPATVPEVGLRATGATYRQIAEQGGGILHTMQQVRAASKKELKRRTIRYLNETTRGPQ